MFAFSSVSIHAFTMIYAQQSTLRFKADTTVRAEISLRRADISDFSVGSGRILLVCLLGEHLSNADRCLASREFTAFETVHL